jgi:hypothetical protein
LLAFAGVSNADVQEDVEMTTMRRALYPLALTAGTFFASVAVCAEPAKSVSNNQQLANAVAGALAQSGSLQGYTVNLNCVNGLVEVTGQVRDQAQHDEVIRLIQGVPNVEKVRDRLYIGDSAKASPKSAPTPKSAPKMSEPSVAPIVQAQAMPSTLPPVEGGGDPVPVYHPNAANPYDNPHPKLPPYAWPTYAPHNNYSRVAYPQAYPYNAWPFIGPFYPFPKVPLGWRKVTLEWEDGHWYYGREGTPEQMWRVRYW